MNLSSDLISQFVKITNDTSKANTETTVYGTVKESGGKTYVKIDGSDLLTPVKSTTDMKDGDRVTVKIKDHTAIATGNITSPAARVDDVTEAGTKISNLEADNVTIKEQLTATEADIDTLQANSVTINGSLEAVNAAISNLEATKLDVDVAEAKYAEIENLDAAVADIRSLEADYGDFKVLSTDKFSATDASIASLQADKLSASDIEGKYANIDFSNIGKAAIEQFFAVSGLIKDVVVGDATISGELVGVTIKGDLVEGNTIVADKLVIQGTDGLYYKLNTDGMSTEAEQTEYNSLNGSVIMAQSITASKINVEDLVAFDATIGGFKITENSIYSGVKDSATNTTRGIFLGNDGQLAFGDADNYIKYYKDTDGTYKLAISAKSISLSTSSKTLEDTISDMQTEMETIKEEVTTFLYIDSSRGTVFKNDNISTVLSVTVYRGSDRITDITTLKSLMGDGAYLQWSFKRFTEDTVYLIGSTDSRIGNDGFTFTISSDDVDAKAIFMCDLIV